MRLLRCTASPWRVAAMLLATLAFATPGVCQEQEDDRPMVPLKRVVLFNSGVGFFEHRGSVTDNTAIELKFNVDDVNDLLKSMVVQDLDGGTVSTVTYGSKDPITKTLKTFAIDLTVDPSLADLLHQIRGSRVEIEAPDESQGVILGVETRTEIVDDKTVSISYLNLLSETGLRSVRLDSISRIQLLDKQLDEELRQALQVLASGNKADKKSVNLQFNGQGERQVRVGYIQETPVWKTSYRLVLDDDKQPYLQGWAIVENTTENDWDDVGLTLVSGRPISFIMDLYQPLYVARPKVELELYASLVPPEYNQDLAEAEVEMTDVARRKSLMRGPSSNVMAGAGGRASGFSTMPAAAPEAAAVADHYVSADGLATTVASVAEAEDVGELFQYQVGIPVSLGRQRSAMLPIVGGNVSADKVSIYNPKTHAKHPLNGLWLTNSTDLHLMQGPATVYDDGVYAGDSKLPDLPPGAKRLVSYALDLDTEVSMDRSPSSDQITSMKIVKGVLHVTRELQREVTYTVKNSGGRDKTVLLEYPRDGEWKLMQPEEPAETTRSEYRFSIDAVSGESTKLKVVERMPQVEIIALNNVDDRRIAIYLSARTISASVKSQLQDVIRRKNEIETAANQRKQLENQIAEISQEQGRIRENMAQLTRNTELYNRYVKKFSSQEDVIETLRERIAELQTQENELRQALSSFLEQLNVQ